MKISIFAEFLPRNSLENKHRVYRYFRWYKYYVTFGDQRYFFGFGELKFIVANNNFYSLDYRNGTNISEITDVLKGLLTK